MNPQNTKRASLSYTDMPPAKLGLYLADVQLPYLRKALSTFVLCSRLISQDKKQPGNRILADLLIKLGERIDEHLKKDGEVLFPYLTVKLANNENEQGNGLRASLSTSHSEHKTIKRMFQKARLLSSDYTPPADASPALKLCYAQLFDFEQDMLRHIFLEEEVLLSRLINSK
jgi:iron-sulfur cluster repair protein YtfE (RIC family)